MAGKRRRPYPSFTDCFRQQGIGRADAAILPGRRQLRNDVIAIRHENDFTAGCHPHVFTEAILQNLKADHFHVDKVASGSYISQG